MVRFIDHVEVRKRIRKKQDLEVKFTHEVYDTFNRLPWIVAIRQTVRAGLRHMLFDEPWCLDQACHEERFLQVWKNHHVGTDRRGVQTLHDRCGSLHYQRPFVRDLGTLNAADCGDLMRLVGAWVEQHPGDKPSITAYSKGQERVGDRVAGGPWDQKVHKVRHRENAFEAAFTKNRRFRDVQVDGAGGMTITYSQEIAMVEQPQDFRRAMLLLGQDKHADHVGVAGRELKRIPVGCHDSILKIDRLFGLRDMCSISGTTADVMYILNFFGRKSCNGYRDLGNIYRVLPFGTIAGFHHHSVLEVALPQSLRGYIDYRIGLPTTLLPVYSFDTSLERALWNVARKYETMMTEGGLHMLCFYHEGFPEGAIVFEGIQDLTRFFNSDVSSARQLSEKVTALPAGKMNLNDMMSAIQTIDYPFWAWLNFKLRRECGTDYSTILETGMLKQVTGHSMAA